MRKLLSVLCALASLAVHGEIEFEHNHVSPQWILEELTFEKFLEKEREAQAKTILELSQRQLDEGNVWRINGKEGKGPMPWDFYKKQVSQALEERSYTKKIRESIQRGSKLYIYRSPDWTWEALHGSEGYILLKGTKVDLWIETKMN